MKNTRFLAFGFALVAALPLAACDSGTIDLDITTTVPSEIAPVSSGVLRLSLWVYDPMLADAPAALADEDSARFSHAQGRANEFRFHVSTDVPTGQQYYVTVRGFELTAECERYILWDGIEGTEAPRKIVMRAVPTPSCQTGQRSRR
jgi:hypothetical protein